MDSIFGNGSTSHTTSWRPEPTHRGTYGILMTCLITLGLCVWTAIHLNIPPRAMWPGQTLRKFGWMVLAFLAPELIAFTAYQQYNDANALRKMFVPHESPQPTRRKKNSSLDLEAQGTGEREKPPGNEGDAEPAIGEGTHPTPASLADANKQPNTIVGRHEWTPVHRFFAIMGGYEIVFERKTDNFFPTKISGERRGQFTLTPDGLRFLAQEQHSLIPDHPRTLIQDKSKGSAMAKTIVCFQAFWFCVQCFVRLGQRIGISLLELNTFGHAICALLLYCFWWNKPLDVQEPEQIVLQDEAAFDLVATMCLASKLDRDRPELADWDDKTKSLKLHVWRDSESGMCHLEHSPETAKMRRSTSDYFGIPPSPAGTLRVKGDIVQVSDTNTPRQVTTDDDPPGPMTLKLIRNEYGAINVSVDEIRRWKYSMRFMKKYPEKIRDFTGARYPNFVTDHCRNIPRFEGIRRDIPLYVVLGIAGLVYGGLHCLAWNAAFATDVERLLWRLSSVTVSSIGVLVVLLYTRERSRPFLNGLGGLGLLGSVVVRVLCDVSVVAYIALNCLARVFLVVESFLNLVHLPDSAYLVPQWSQYVPHIS